MKHIAEPQHDLIAKSLGPTQESVHEWKIIAMNFHSYGVKRMAVYVQRAVAISKTLSKLATAKAKQAFAEMVNDSLADHDKWLHKFCRNERPANPYVSENDHLKNNIPANVIDKATEEWAAHWQQNDTVKVLGAIDAIRSYRSETIAMNAGMPYSTAVAVDQTSYPEQSDQESTGSDVIECGDMDVDVTEGGAARARAAVPECTVAFPSPMSTSDAENPMQPKPKCNEQSEVNNVISCPGASYPENSAESRQRPSSEGSPPEQRQEASERDDAATEVIGLRHESGVPPALSGSYSTEAIGDEAGNMLGDGASYPENPFI